MNNRFSGFNTKEVTLEISPFVEEGMAVYLATPTIIDLPAVGQAICGVCTKIRNGLASVVMSGHATVAYSGTAPTIGFCKLAGDGAGAVKLSDDGKEYLVVDVDETEKTIDIII